MPTRKHKLVKTRKFQRGIDNRLTEVRILIKEIRRFLNSYRGANGEDAVILEEKIDALLLELDNHTKILYRHRKYYEELAREFEDIRREKESTLLKQDNGLEEGGEEVENSAVDDGEEA